MVFRADEATQNGLDMAIKHLTPREANSEQREKIRVKLVEIITECGPVIEGYPAWHPFMIESAPQNYSPMTPGGEGSFRLLDHTVYLANGIITCPYSHAVEPLFAAIATIKTKHPSAYITIEKIEDVHLYNDSATSILIRCHWMDDLNDDGTIPCRLALGLMLEREIPNWRVAKFSESWDRMKGQIMGYPHGGRSSLFVNQQTGQTMKTVWNHLVKSGLWGQER